MLLGTRLGFGVRALYELAILPERRSTVRDLARKCEVTEAVLRRILLDLREAGYLEAQKGRAGGFSLRKDPAQICIADVARALEREPAVALGGSPRDWVAVDPSSPLASFWETLEKKFLGELERATLADVIALAGESRPAPSGPAAPPRRKRVKRSPKGRSRRTAKTRRSRRARR